VKNFIVFLFASVAVLALGAGVLLTTPRLENETSRNRREAGILVETARRQLARYQPSLALLEAFLPGADWLATGGKLDADSLEKLIRNEPGPAQEVDQVLRDLYTAYERGRSNVPEASRDLMLAWGYPKPLIEDSFYVAGQAGKRAGEYRSRQPDDRLPTGDALMSSLGTEPTQQSQALRNAAAKTRQRYTAILKALEDAAAQLRQAINLVPDHVAANRLLAMVEYQQALRKRFEGLGRRRLAERLRPRLVELAGRIQSLEARATSIRRESNIPTAQERLDAEARAMHDRIAEQEQTIARLRDELAAREQLLQDRRSSAEKARKEYENALRASYDADRPDSFAEYLRSVRQTGQQMSATAAELEAAENGTVTGVRLESPDDPLTGAYVPDPADAEVHHVRSVAAISGELTAQQNLLERMQASVKDVTARHRRLGEVRSLLDEELERHDRQLEAMRKQLDELRNECERLVADAKTAEQQGLSDHAAQARRYLDSARRGAASRMSDARTAQTEAGGTPAPHLDMKQQERWLVAGLEALEGEIRLLEASIHLQEANDLRSHLRAMTAAARAGASGASPEQIEETLEDARLAAGEAAYAAAEKFSRAIRSDAQWVYGANLGAALTLLTQIDPGNEAYRAKALEALRSALEGRPDDATGWAKLCIDRMKALVATLEKKSLSETTEHQDKTDAEPDGEAPVTDSSAEP
jgi:tetratricopeptide (TPR) repeat protein